MKRRRVRAPVAVGTVLRRALTLTLWGALLIVWCRNLRIDGLDNVPDEPVLVVANHTSHADTVLLQFALAISHRHPVLVAGAEDYWFRDWRRSLLASALGVFPFPRRGELGVQRARAALDDRTTVVLFPQGSRTGGRFRAGVGRIVAGGTPQVLPVRIDGADRILPRGRRWPRRACAHVTIGRCVAITPGETPSEFADRLERIVLGNLARAS